MASPMDNIESTSFKVGFNISAGQSASPSAGTTIVKSFPSNLKSITGDTVNKNTEAPACIMFQAYDISSGAVSDLQNLRGSYIRKSTRPLGGIGSKSLSGGLTSNIKAAFQQVTSLSSLKNSGYYTKDAVATFLMPMSSTDVEVVQNKFNANSQGKLDRAGGSFSNMLSNAASDFFMSGIENATGIYADSNEALYSASRQVFAGTEVQRRDFTFSCVLKNKRDSDELNEIIEYFKYFAHGSVGNSTVSKELTDKGADYANNIIGQASVFFGSENHKSTKDAVDAIAAFFSNAQVTTNPTVWFVKKVGTGAQANNIFGPAQIVSVRCDDAPDGEFFSNMLETTAPMKRNLVITMQEITPRTRATYGSPVVY